MSFVVQYKDVPAVNNKWGFFKIDVHFRGYDVGDITKIKLSEDQSHLEFFVDIYYKNLRIPTNSLIMFKSENIYGTRYLDIEPPEISSGKFVANGDVVEGFAAFERVDQYLIDELTKGEIGQVIHNLNEITGVLLRSVNEKDIESTIKHSSSSLRSLDEILNKKSTKEAIANSPVNMQKTLKMFDSANKNMEKALELMPVANKHMEIGNKQMEIGNKNMELGNSLMKEANSNLDTMNKKVPPSLIENAEKLIVKTDCLENETIKLISKRWLIPRFIFGRPGKSFTTCIKKQCPINQSKN